MQNTVSKVTTDKQNSKRFLPDLDTSFWTIFTKKESNTRRIFSDMIGIITEYNFLASFEHKIGKLNSPNCTICNAVKAMNSYHITFYMIVKHS